MNQLPTFCQRLVLGTLFVCAVSAQAAVLPDIGNGNIDNGGPVTQDGSTVRGPTAAVSPSRKAVNSFTFAAQTGATRSTTVTSSPAIMSGIGLGNNVNISITGGAATYSVNGVSRGSATTTVIDTDSVTVQLPTSATYFTTTTATVTVGTVSADFNVTTLAATPTGVSFTALTDVATSAVLTSNTVTIGGLGAGGAPISISGGTYSINGAAYVSTSGMINDADTLTLKVTSSSSNSVFSQALVTIGGFSASFNVTTIQSPGVAAILPSLPISIPGTSSTPAIGNLGTGSGPNVASGVASVLTGALGKSLHYISQSAQGTATLSGYNGGNLAFMPLMSQTTDSRVNGVYAVGNGQYQVVFNGYSNTIAPALVHLDQLLALLPGVVATQQANGVIVATYNGAIYAVQPGVQVQVGPATGAASLFLGNDGLYRFIDAQGNAQVLYPAFADVTTLRGSVAPNMLAAGSATIQLDGTARLIGSGQSYTLGPDYTLGGIPAANAGQIVWQESAQRYRMTNASISGTTQGFNTGP